MKLHLFHTDLIKLLPRKKAVNAVSKAYRVCKYEKLKITERRKIEKWKKGKQNWGQMEKNNASFCIIYLNRDDFGVIKMSFLSI